MKVNPSSIMTEFPLRSHRSGVVFPPLARPHLGGGEAGNPASLKRHGLNWRPAERDESMGYTLRSCLLIAYLSRSSRSRRIRHRHAPGRRVQTTATPTCPMLNLVVG